MMIRAKILLVATWAFVLAITFVPDRVRAAGDGMDIAAGDDIDIATGNGMDIAAGNGMDILVQLTPKAQTVLSSELAARIDQLPFKEGESFHKGDILVGFDCAENEGKLAAAEATARIAEAKLDTAQRLLKFNSVTDLEVAIEKASLAKARAEASVEAVVVSKCSLTAPFDGKVADLRVFNHQFVNRGDALLRIIDDTALEVEFLAPSTWLSHVAIGQKVDVVVGETLSTYEAQIERIGATVDPVSHSVKFIGRINGRPAGLTVGMTGRIALPAAIGQ